MSKFKEFLNGGKKKSAAKGSEPRHPNVIQQEYNETCAKLGQDVVRLEDLSRASEMLKKGVESYKTRIFELLNEIPAAREHHDKKAAEAKATATESSPEATNA